MPSLEEIMLRNRMQKPASEKAGVASKPVVTAALKEEVKKTGRKPVGDRPMTNAERQARYRARKKENS